VPQGTEKGGLNQRNRRAFTFLFRGVEYVQHLIALPVAVLIIQCKSSKIDELRPLVPDVLSALTLLRPQTLAHVG
jgi:hypothetical protein